MQKILDMSMKLVTIFFFIFFFVGGIVALTYCIRIGYFPAGLDVGDSLFFLSVAICFSFIYVVYLLSMSSISLCLLWCFSVPINKMFSLAEILFKSKMPQLNRFDKEFRPIIIAGILVAIIFFASFYDIGLSGFVISTLATILTISAFMFVLLLTNEDVEPAIYAKFHDFQLPEEKRRVYVKGILLLSIFFSPLIYSEIFFQVGEVAFVKIGVSKRHADVYLDRKMEPVFEDAGTVNKDYLILKGVEILWTGVGSRSVIRVEIDGKPRKFVVNTNDVLFSYP